MASALQGDWFDGRSAQAQPVQVAWQGGQLLLTHEDGRLTELPGAGIVWPEHTRHGLRQVVLPGGKGVITFTDAAAWDDWARCSGLAQPLAARWALSWKGALLALLLVMATGFAAWRWAIPLGAQQLAGWVPQSFQERLGQRLMSDLERRDWLQPSQLPVEAQQRITDAVMRMAVAAYPDGTMPHYRLNLRRAPAWLGPNALALPSGDIVVTDALVELLASDSVTVPPALLGVVAHELGHVRERHGLRSLFEAGALSALFGWWIGDYSALLASAPALMLQTGYSRGHERAADAESLRVMRAAGIDPRSMVIFFKKLQETMPERDPDDQALGLATHPADSERIRFFEQGR